jgi:hypothetical protein
MQAYLIAGAVALIIALVVLWVIVRLAKKTGVADGHKKEDEKFHERRRDADEIMSENVADELAWLERQAGDPHLTSTLTRLRLRDLQRQLGSGPGGPTQERHAEGGRVHQAGDAESGADAAPTRVDQGS